MENRSELLSLRSLIFPSLIALRADLQSESTMMPSELVIFVRENGPGAKSDVGDMLFAAVSDFVCKFNGGKFPSAFGWKYGWEAISCNLP
ncbi:hypothetical protein TNCV_2725151 [Trichonephila clavipes]|nr:hypothetical protein TNCV_2725151 [Trichonephila clavipes]